MIVRSEGLRLQNKDSAMTKLVSTQKRKKEKLRTKPTRIVHGFQTREVQPQFAWFTDFSVYADF